MHADKAYDASERVILPLTQRDIEVVIPSKNNSKEPRMTKLYIKHVTYSISRLNEVHLPNPMPYRVAAKYNGYSK